MEGMIDKQRAHCSQRSSLDSKLRRLVHSVSHPEHLVHDVRRGFVQTAEVVTESYEPSPSKLTKRVLVKLATKEIPEKARSLHWSRVVGDYYTVSVPVDQLEELGEAPEVEYVTAGHGLQPALDSSVPEIHADQAHIGPPPTTGAGVIVGIIDFGFDFTLDDFRNSDGSSRVAFYWNQVLNNTGGQPTPSGFAYGVEYDRTILDQALASSQPFELVRNSNTEANPQPLAHGTHVAGIATGNGRSNDADHPAGIQLGVAPESTIVFVQPSSNDVTTSFTDSVHVADAISYIFQKADELGMPCVINMSLGQNGGSHDGESVVERAIDRLLEQPGRAMVVAAGNEHVWRGHASGNLTENVERVLSWGVGGSMSVGGGTTGAGTDRTHNEMEVWLSSRDALEVQVTSPEGLITEPLVPGDTAVFQFPTGEQVFIDYVRFSILNGDSQIYVEIIPEPVVGGIPNITSGTWEVILRGTSITDGHFDAWIERDARIRGNNFADQSFFVGADFDPVMTLGTPATSRRSVAVANYDHVTQAISASSSRGRTRDGRAKPDVAAPGTNIISSGSMGGHVVAGSQIPVRVAMSGTSMSAPHVAGVVALMLEANPTLTADQIQKVVIASGRPPAGSTASNFSSEFGYGRVDALQAVTLVRNAT